MSERGTGARRRAAGAFAARALAAALAAILGAGCPRKPADPPAGAARPAQAAEVKASARDLAIQEVVGSLKLVRTEYAKGVRDGQVVDPGEYDEAAMFCERAGDKLALGGAAIKAKDAAAAAEVERAVAELEKLIAAKGPVAREEELVRAAVARLEALLDNPVPPAVRGVAEAVDLADQVVQAEVATDSGYRIGVFIEGRQAVLGPDGRPVGEGPDAAATHFLGVLVRERRTKRSLPSASVSVRLDGKEYHLDQIWGAYELYGRNVELPAGTQFALDVEVAPPDYCRHGDMLGYLEKATARFAGGRDQAGRVRVEGAPPAPTDPDYRVGDDVLQARSEAKELKEAGPYTVCFIYEVPEPIWCVASGKAELEAVKPDDTNHLEIALMDRRTGRMVTNARVTLALRPLAGGEALSVPLVGLLSSFYHYGRTTRVPDGDYAVEATIEPPSFCYLGEAPFTAPLKVEFVWCKAAKPALPKGGKEG